MSLKKQYLKNRPVCKVTFRVSKAAARSSGSIHLVGDFNAWDAQAMPMTALKSGEFTSVLELGSGQEYQFRYVYGDGSWENDWDADGYAANGLDGENSIVRV